MINKNNILAIDFGTKLIGLAICYKDTSFSVPYATLENKSNVYSELKRIVEEELIDLIVVGFPKTENNYVSERHKLINDFINHLKQFTKIKIQLVDESYSTIESFNSQKEFGIKSSKIKKTKDQNSAIVILNRYLQSK